MPNTVKERINALRKFLEEKDLDAFIIPSTDPHLCEYPASHWKSREWISGFYGSAGTVVVTRDKAGLWTDSRYFLQAAKELEGTEIILFKEGIPSTPKLEEWILGELSERCRVGIDGNVSAASETTKLICQLGSKNIMLLTDYDPFASIWKDRAPVPSNPIYIYPLKYAGVSAASKLKMLRKEIRNHGANAILISSIDTIAWLYNIRGNDIKFNPVAICHTYVSEKECVLYIDPQKLDTEIVHYLQMEGVKTEAYDNIFDFVKTLGHETNLCIQSNKISFRLYESISKECRLIDISSPADLLKSKKNETEIQGIRNAMERDGVALVRFLMWLYKSLETDSPDELKISQKLSDLRNEQDHFVGNSFESIVGYGANGAIVHYAVSSDSSAKIKAKGFLLIDSGGQYKDGTTDITRTINLGDLTDQMKEDYTRVLKGHISIATCRFPEGTRGSQIDILARKSLWDLGLNYLHGTGHGVGHFLNVHEGPQSIRMNENSTTLQIGMITSNEPGLYRANKYGIRIENLILTRDDITTEFGKFYSFETLSLCPIDTTPIVKEMLGKEDVSWLNNYHELVYDRLSPLLEEEERKWLREKTKAI